MLLHHLTGTSVQRLPFLPRILLHNQEDPGWTSATGPDVRILQGCDEELVVLGLHDLIGVLRELHDTKRSRWFSDNSLCMMKNNVRMLSDSGKA